MTGHCNGCGDCCYPVELPEPKTRLLRSGRRDPRDVAWARGLRRISREAAVRLSFPLAGRRGFYYLCPRFDEQSRSCSIHDQPEFPPVCSGYPWYESNKEPPPREKSEIVSPRCGYIEDTPQFVGYAIPVRRS